MPKKRFVTYFGIPLPPWKEQKIGAGSVTIRFVIKGIIPSKKNNQQAVTIRKDARSYIKGMAKSTGKISEKEAQNAISKTYSKMRSNKAYNEFVLAQKPVIQEQMAEWSRRLMDKYGPIFPIKKAAMSIRLYFSKKYITDTVNKQQTIQDLLIESQVVCNDDYNTLNPIISESQCYADEILESIAFISLSFKVTKNTD